MVRCGACLRVFAADDNLLPSVDLRTINRPVQEEIEEELEEFEDIDEQLPISELEIDEEESSEDTNEDNISTLDMADSVPNRLSPQISTSEPFWQLLDDETPDQADPEIPSQHVETEENAQELPDNETFQEVSFTIEADEEEKVQEGAAKSSATDITSSARPDGGASIRSRMTALEFDDDVLSDGSDDRSLSQFSAQEIEAVSDAEDPLELSWQETPRRKGPQRAFLLLSIVLVLSIAGQALWFNKLSLSQNASLRPMLDLFCSALPCDLPPLVNIRAIRSDSLVVRSHSEIANALSVNFQFRNDAAFAQPFPNLALRFMDSDEQLVAQRQFTPQEYLPTGVAELQLMPPMSPVQVRLEILDPGSEAVNYEVSFFANLPK